MKKWISLLLALAMMLSIVACGSNNTANNGGNDTANNSATNNEDSSTNEGSTEEENTDSELSATVQQLYAEFDAAMEEQIGPMPENFGDIKVGAVVISLTNPFWVNMKNFYEAAGEELGIDIDVQTGTTEGDTASQLDVLMTMADMDYDVIIVSPIDGTNLIPGIVKCNENGVKVINLGPGVDVAALEDAGGHLDATITVAFTEQGETVANDMISRLPDGGQVAIIAGLCTDGISAMMVWLPMFGQQYLDMGVNAGALRRLLLCTTQTFDSLPHAQSIANTLGVFGLTHKQAYKELFVTTVIFPTIFSIFCCICCILFYPV